MQRPYWTPGATKSAVTPKNNGVKPSAPVKTTVAPPAAVQCKLPAAPSAATPRARTKVAATTKPPSLVKQLLKVCKIVRQPVAPKPVAPVVVTKTVQRAAVQAKPRPDLAQSTVQPRNTAARVLSAPKARLQPVTVTLPAKRQPARLPMRERLWRMTDVNGIDSLVPTTGAVYGCAKQCTFDWAKPTRPSTCDGPSQGQGSTETEIMWSMLTHRVPVQYSPSLSSKVLTRPSPWWVSYPQKVLRNTKYRLHDSFQSLAPDVLLALGYFYPRPKARRLRLA
ncbi:hypothetical protein SDRG_05999 [Saprolegnia diclina VS20]|uniref:Uncharacterized protein n=1 Tax=Saprolegnia diclina (strain VS20) TaxID=1156394 RepID=T0QRJ8_SAPDV|nr:hypothetical protein SDRG_05999 [Saprolegnia diclina VS20]EQC36550.1 hypothetical protein SDRG_05999 [Saprolegnia diclina VS20]|eukprot:XP_008609971.1 hypothetical protein SDRG_05999 [Saprolegnia diclina VS20]